jgi:hypothetical protein
MVFFVLLLLFTGSATFFALNLKRAIIPDEPAHFILSKHFSTTWGIPPDIPETYHLGYISHKPFLYYWLNGRFLNVVEFLIPNMTDWRQLAALRLLNVIYSTLAVIFCYLLSKEIFENRWWQIFSSFLLTNTLMFVFLSGGVNYDNLTNLCAFASIYFLVRVIIGKSFYENSMGWLIFISANTLTEKKALPLALITGVVWLLYIMKNRQYIDLRPKWNWKLNSLIVIFVSLFFLNISIWGVNLVKYHAIRPPCNKIMTEDQCNLSPFVARAQKLNLPEKLTLINVIEEHYPDPLEYVWDYWTFSMLKRIYGIMGHKSYFPDLIITFYRLLIIWVMVVAIRYWKHLTFMIGSLTTILVFYSITLLATNYNGELITGFKHVAIQGRYIFPVIGVAYTLIAYYISQIQNTTLRRATVLYTILLFLWGSPLLFLINLPPALTSWFN